MQFKRIGYAYNFVSKININWVQKGSLVPIYNSSINESNLKGFASSYIPFFEYFQLVPFFLERSLFNQSKQFVLSMKFSRETKLLELQCLSHAGIFTKYVLPENIIPVPYSDYKLNSRFNFFAATSRIDYDMIYWNNLQQEFYLFDKEGQWHEADLPELSIERLFDEKKFLDNYF